MNQSSNNTHLRVCRGGGWNSTDAARVRARVRVWDDPSFRIDNLGFRCALRGREPRV